MDKIIADTPVTQTMNQAIFRRNPDKGLIIHSDRGANMPATTLKHYLPKKEFIGSISRKGDCWDNAVAESFIHTLKVELVHWMKFKTREEAKRRIFEYVEMYYNTKRAYSTLGYLSPFEYEERSLQTL
ncbi:MAG: IS3 family transposase [Candidatus Omnitrophota bacterium]|jgi:transposase InsO family protein